MFCAHNCKSTYICIYHKINQVKLNLPTYSNLKLFAGDNLYKILKDNCNLIKERHAQSYGNEIAAQLKIKKEKYFNPDLMLKSLTIG